MLLSRYRKEGGDEYHEFVITTTDDPEEVRLDEYVEENRENQKNFYIPYEAAEE